MAQLAINFEQVSNKYLLDIYRDVMMEVNKRFHAGELDKDEKAHALFTADEITSIYEE